MYVYMYIPIDLLIHNRGQGQNTKDLFVFLFSDDEPKKVRFF